jgi:hypothetical protein
MERIEGDFSSADNERDSDMMIGGLKPNYRLPLMDEAGGSFCRVCARR